MLTKNNITKGREKVCEKCGKSFHASLENIEIELCLQCQEKVYKELGGDY